MPHRTSSAFGALPGLRVLVVDDEAETRRMLCRVLTRAGCVTTESGSGSGALRALADARPDLMLLDMVLDDLHGLEVLDRVRADPELRGVPVIIVSGQGGDDEIVDGLVRGAEDYITKPVVGRVLLARVQAVVRRAREARPAGPRVVVGSIEVDGDRHEVRVQGRLLALTVAQFRLVETLATAPGRVYTRDELIARALGEESDALHRTVDVHICAIRKALGAERARLETVRGVGYRLRGSP
jgi:DNA-binding response OmpR family regulator